MFTTKSRWTSRTTNDRQPLRQLHQLFEVVGDEQTAGGGLLGRLFTKRLLELWQRQLVAKIALKAAGDCLDLLRSWLQK